MPGLGGIGWEVVGKLIAPLAPTIGGVIGDLIPVPGASFAGRALGSMLAKHLGVEDTPAAVAGAIATTPNDILLAKLKAVSAEAAAMWPAWAEVEKAHAHLAEVQVSQVNATMRAEIGSPSIWDKWRAACGWVLMYMCFSTCTLVLVAVIMMMMGNPEPLKELTAAWPLIAALLGILAAIVGVKVWSNDRAPLPALATGQVQQPVKTK